MSFATPPSVFTLTSALSLTGVLLVFFIAYAGSKIFLPKTSRWQDRYIFIWLVYQPPFSAPPKLTIVLSRHLTFSFTSRLKGPSSTSLHLDAKSTPAPAPWLKCVRTLSFYTTHNKILTFRIFKNAGREYAAADFRWGVSDPGVVSLELLTVFGAGPLGCYILAQLAKQDPARHYWIVVLSTAELYGGCVEPFSG